MRNIHIRFEQNADTSDIEVVIRASQKDHTVISLMNRLRDPLSDTLAAENAEGLSVMLEKNRILSISSDSKKLKVVTLDGIYKCVMTLQEIEQSLDPQTFLRISRYEIINLARVEKFDFSVSGSLHIFMENSFETWASRRFIPVIKHRLKGSTD